MPASPDGQQCAQILPKGIARMTAKGRDQLSYSAASTKKDHQQSKGKYHDGLPPAFCS